MASVVELLYLFIALNSLYMKLLPFMFYELLCLIEENEVLMLIVAKLVVLEATWC